MGFVQLYSATQQTKALEFPNEALVVSSASAGGGITAGDTSCTPCTVCTFPPKLKESAVSSSSKIQARIHGQ